jgi:sarcosine oxidase
VTEVEFVVVGTGVMGAAAGRALARAGREVVMLERFRIGHHRGSSHGDARIFRFFYQDPLFVRMAQQALPLWRELEEESEQSLLTITGGMDIGEAALGHAAAMESCGAAFQLVDRSGAERLFPGLSFPEDTPMVHQPDAGALAAERAWAALAASAKRHGAELREGVRVTELAPAGNGAEIRTEDGTYRARVAVVTAGAWARGLLGGMGVDLHTRPSRETVAYFRAPDGLALPALVEWHTPALYALPSPQHGLKAGEHRGGPSTDPEAEVGPDQASVARLRAWVAERFPAVDPEPLLAETCLYTNTADEHFILERHGPVVVGSACSGHAFKFAPLIGERLAELALP